MFKRISATALALTFIALVAGCDEGADSNNNAAPGLAAAPGPAARVPRPQPLEAVFTQESFTTVYTGTIENPDRDELFLSWSGASCGVGIPAAVSCSAASCTTTYTWNHASPPCPEHSHHDDATIILQVVGKRSGRTVNCIYKGSASGTGPTCYQNGFNATEFGNPHTNQAFVRYHLPLGKQCSRVDLIQVVSIVENRSGRVVIPHNNGMDESESPLYQMPLAADDVGGYVVDKFKFEDAITTNDPYYGGAVRGTPTQDAELDDRPSNTRDGHHARFEVCAFCSGNRGDADFGTYLDCLTWEHDADTGEAKRSDPQPTQTPTPEFRAAVAKWNENKRFTMPQ